MGFFDNIIRALDSQYDNVEYREDLVGEIKRHIKSVLNTNAADCLVMDGGDFFSMDVMSLDSIEICRHIGSGVQNIISEYEKRLEIVSIIYDDSNLPWKLVFILHCRLKDNKFKEFDINIEFTNNRYCEVN